MIYSDVHKLPSVDEILNQALDDLDRDQGGLAVKVSTFVDLDDAIWLKRLGSSVLYDKLVISATNIQRIYRGRRDREISRVAKNRILPWNLFESAREIATHKLTSSKVPWGSATVYLPKECPFIIIKQCRDEKNAQERVNRMQQAHEI